MGLRERNAAQTRELILDTALELFTEQGFDATTMEQIATGADIGTSTLYRYFPTKDELLTAPLALHGQMAAEFRRRPPEESLDVALGHALQALLLTPRPDMARLDLLFTVLRTAPGPQARLLEDAAREQALLARAIAERLGRPEDDPSCGLTARMTMAVLDLLDLAHHDDLPQDNEAARRRAVDSLGGMLDQLHRDPPVLPRFES